LSLGDDAAAFRGREDLCWLATCDAQIDGVHFLSARTDPAQLGHRIAAVNLSDIAAMGGIPRFAFAALRVPRALDASWVDSVYGGLQAGLAQAGASILGGNTARSDGGFSMDLFLLGQVEPERILTRSAVKPGDVLCVTGTLGDSCAGLYLLDYPDAPVSAAVRSFCVGRHCTPTARLSVGRFLGDTGSVHACIDISDGLVADAAHLAKASGLSLRIDARSVPLHPMTLEAADAAGVSAVRWALQGGEDFELLFAVPRNSAAEVARQCEAQTGVRVTVVGEAHEGAPEVGVVGADAADLNQRGFDHLRRAEGDR
jgi:thiamine-monophosphate kinase